jgi:hypothetical protein
MAVNNNGNLLDSAGEVAIDFVWGNMPLQPNDVRPDATGATLSTTVTTRVPGRLDPEEDGHIIALSGWNGYPQYTPNTAGEDVAGDTTDYVLVPSVLGFTTALATDAMRDASLVSTTATAATNAAITVTAAARTVNTTTLTFTAAGAGAAYPVGTKVIVSVFGGDDAFLNGTYTVIATATNTFSVTTTGTGAVALTGKSAAVNGVAGTIKTQSIAAGANNTAIGAAVTITPWATAS